MNTLSNTFYNSLYKILSDRTNCMILYASSKDILPEYLNVDILCAVTNMLKKDQYLENVTYTNRSNSTEININKFKEDVSSSIINNPDLLILFTEKGLRFELEDALNYEIL